MGFMKKISNKSGFKEPVSVFPKGLNSAGHLSDNSTVNRQCGGF